MHEQSTIILTTVLPLEDWGPVLDNTAGSALNRPVSEMMHNMTAATLVVIVRFTLLVLTGLFATLLIAGGVMPFGSGLNLTAGFVLLLSLAPQVIAGRKLKKRSSAARVALVSCGVTASVSFALVYLNFFEMFWGALAIASLALTVALAFLLFFRSDGFELEAALASGHGPGTKLSIPVGLAPLLFLGFYAPNAIYALQHFSDLPPHYLSVYVTNDTSQTYVMELKPNDNSPGRFTEREQVALPPNGGYDNFLLTYKISDQRIVIYDSSHKIAGCIPLTFLTDTIRIRLSTDISQCP